jgi:hypothetical protein
MVAPLSLDIHKLSAMVPPDHVSAPFFLGRSSPKAHGIALSKFASSLNIESGRQRRVWIEAIASIYCRDAGAVIWDWKATAPLIFKCGMLPPGSELRYHAIDTGGSFRLEAESNAPNKSSLLHQKEILEDVLLPTANESIQSSDASTLSRVLAIAVGLFGALERRDCPPCPALECFIVALLWRLGRDQELMAMLESRASAGRQSSRPCVGDFYNRNRTLVDHGTMILAKMIVAITNEVTFGASSRMHIRRSDGKFISLCPKCQKLYLSWRDCMLYSYSTHPFYPYYIICIRSLQTPKARSDTSDEDSNVAIFRYQCFHRLSSLARENSRRHEHLLHNDDDDDNKWCFGSILLSSPGHGRKLSPGSSRQSPGGDGPSGNLPLVLHASLVPVLLDQDIPVGAVVENQS